jgi:hypothetical protein
VVDVAVGIDVVVAVGVGVAVAADVVAGAGVAVAVDVAVGVAVAVDVVVAVGVGVAMMTYWYVSRPNEIFLDLDSRKARTRSLHVLRRAMATKRLSVESVWLYPTITDDHSHLIVVLREPLPFLLRVSWSLWMGGDQIRAAYVLERYRQGFEEAELLCSKMTYWFRAADDVCSCEGKHKAKSVTDKCSALKKILGDHRSADYFPRNHDRIARQPLMVEWGKVPKSRIREWR